MSIIEEALRRLQDPLLHPAQKPQTQAPVAPPLVKPVEPKPIHSWPTAAAPTPTPTPLPYSSTLLAAAVAAIILSSLAVLAGGAWWLGHLSRPTSTASSTIPAPTLAALPAIPQPSQPAPSARSQDGAPTGQAQSERPMSAVEHPPVPATIHPIANLSDELVISGLVVGGGESYAVINGAIVAVGDQIGDFTLVEITNGAARLRRTDGSEVALRVSR